jgi:hypothetical protein
LIQPAILCLLIGESRSLTLSVNIERYVVITDIFWFCSVWLFVFFICLCTHLVKFLSPHSFMLQLSSSFVYMIPLSIFFNAGLVVMNYFSNSWKVFTSPSVMNDSFSGFSGTGFELRSSCLLGRCCYCLSHSARG